MSEQMGLFNGDVARAARDEAIDRAGAHASQAWMDAAFHAASRIAPGARFTTDDLWPALDGHWTHEPRALGAVMQRVAKMGIARATNDHVLSKRPQCHARPLRVWVRL